MNACDADDVQGLLACAAKQFGDLPALLDVPSGECITFSALPRRAAEVYGQYPSSRRAFATALPTNLHHALVLLGALAAGHLVVPLPTRLPQALALDLASRAGASFLLTNGSTPLPVEPCRESSEPPAPLATLLFTSGSTGKPKGIGHPLSAHRASATGAASLIPLGPGDQWLMNLPLYHVSGLSILFRCLFFGACAVFSAPGALPSSITHASLVATQLYRFLDKGIRPPSTLRAVLAGGGPFPDSLLRRALRAGWPLHLTYGMTEAASQICTSQLLDPDVKEFFCGHPLPGRALRIAPDGEILLSGPVLFSHSLGSGNRFEPRRGNWYATGDLGEYEETKGLRIIGRRDRMFISGGENIHPEQIERALLEIPGVFGAIVLPVSDPEFGNRPIAFLQCSFSLDSPSDRERIVSHLRERIPSTHLPTDILPMPEFANGLKPSFKTLAEYLQNARTTF